MKHDTLSCPAEFLGSAVLSSAIWDIGINAFVLWCTSLPEPAMHILPGELY